MYALDEYQNLNTHQRALLMAYLCHVVYTSSIKWKELLAIPVPEITGVIRSVKYWVVVSEGTQYVVISGTDTKNGIWETIKDLSISANLLPVLGENKVIYHRGYHNIARDMAKELKGHIDHTKPIVIVGHSMGGAIAKILTGIFSVHQTHLYTFGAPQVSMGPYAELSYDHYHYIKHGDFIPSYPSSIFWDDLPAYLLVGNELRLTQPRRLGVLIPTYRRIREAIKYKDKRGVFHPHALTSYIRRLNRIDVNPGHETT